MKKSVWISIAINISMHFMQSIFSPLKTWTVLESVYLIYILIRTTIITFRIWNGFECVQAQWFILFKFESVNFFFNKVFCWFLVCFGKIPDAFHSIISVLIAPKSNENKSCLEKLRQQHTYSCKITFIESKHVWAYKMW